jgi:hypothetical protein
MGRFVLQLVLAVLGFGCGIGLLKLALPEKRGTVRVYTPSAYCAALLAGPCVWFFDYLLWQPLTGHWSQSFDNRWTIWFIGLGGTIFAWLCGRFQRLYRLRTLGYVTTFLSGLVLVVLPLFYTGWFGPGSTDTALPWLAGLAAILAVVTFVVWLRRRKPSAKSSPASRRALGVMACLLAILAVFGFVLPTLTDGSTGSKASATPLTSAPPYHQRTPSECVGEDGKVGGKTGFNVVFNSNTKNDDISGGIDTVNTEKGLNQVLDVAHHDPRYLFKLIEASPLGKERFPELTNYRQLMGKGQDDGCYSVLGRNAYNTLQGLLYSPKTKVVSTTASYGINSGTYHNGSPFLEPASVLTGDKRAMQVTFANGQVMDILHRCGNVFVPGNTPPPNVPTTTPPGTTPPPSTPPSTTPPHVCVTPPPPGSTGYKFNPQTCTWYKPAQSWDCQQNPHPGCPPNPAHQPPQSNDPTLTAQPTTVPTKAPPQKSPEPIDTASPPPPTPGGHDGGSTSQPGTTAPPHTPLPSATATGDPGGF